MKPFAECILSANSNERINMSSFRKKALDVYFMSHLVIKINWNTNIFICKEAIYIDSVSGKKTWSSYMTWLDKKRFNYVYCVTSNIYEPYSLQIHISNAQSDIELLTHIYGEKRRVRESWGQKLYFGFLDEPDRWWKKIHLFASAAVIHFLYQACRMSRRSFGKLLFAIRVSWKREKISLWRWKFSQLCPRNLDSKTDLGMAQHFLWICTEAIALILFSVHHSLPVNNFCIVCKPEICLCPLCGRFHLGYIWCSTYTHVIYRYISPLLRIQIILL